MTAVLAERTGAGGGLDFALGTDLEAAEPPEHRPDGRRDGVRLLVSIGERDPVHARFDDLPAFLHAGDLLVVNNSATLPASVRGVTDHGDDIEVHLSTELPTSRGLWLVELRTPAHPASRPRDADASGRTIWLPDAATVDVITRYRGSRRLWLALVDTGGWDLTEYLHRFGRPIRYRHVPHDWPIGAYQTVFALEPGSAEMPSAARPLTPALVSRLVAGGIGITPVTLHTGVSSLEGHEQPYPERVRVPAATAARINDVRRHGSGRVVAVGTTAVRAVEAATGAHGLVRPLDRWTDLVVTPARGVSGIDGLLTGWHEPEASHLWMLEAVAGRPALDAAYRAAVRAGYRWHEFGDAHLILPDGPAA